MSDNQTNAAALRAEADRLRWEEATAAHLRGDPDAAQEFERQARELEHKAEAVAVTPALGKPAVGAYLTEEQRERAAAARAEREVSAGASLLDRVARFLERFVVFQSDAQRDAVALWAAHAHAPDVFATTPRLSVRSPEKESGKTRLLEVLELLVRAPLLVANVSEAALFRLVAAEPVTLLHDEADATFGPKARDREDLRALLNAGHRRGAQVARCVGEGSKLATKRFPVFAPVALAGIGTLPDTLESRCIVVALKRRAAAERVEDFEREAIEDEGRRLHDELAEWVEVGHDHLRSARPERVEGVRDRAWDNWRPLLAIAEHAGGDWPERGRRAARQLTAGAAENEQSQGVRLLRDLHRVFDGHGALFTNDLRHALNELEESPWGGWRNSQGLDARGLARMLRPYDVRPRDIRIGDEVKKGYRAEDFADAWARYLPPDARLSRNSATTVTAQGDSSATRTPHVADSEAPDSLTPQRLSPMLRIEPATGEATGPDACPDTDGAVRTGAAPELGAVALLDDLDEPGDPRSQSGPECLEVEAVGGDPGPSRWAPGELPTGWYAGSIGECVGCGRSCASYDVRRRCRHPWCREKAVSA